MKQEWNFQGEYRFKCIELGGNPSIYHEGKYKELNSIRVKNMDDKNIEFELEIIRQEYNGLFSYDHFYNESFVFDIENYEKNKRVFFSNRDKDYIDLVIDRDVGIYIEKYNYDKDKKYHYYISI